MKKNIALLPLAADFIAVSILATAGTNRNEGKVPAKPTYIM